MFNVLYASASITFCCRVLPNLKQNACELTYRVRTPFRAKICGLKNFMFFFYKYFNHHE